LEKLDKMEDNKKNTNPKHNRVASNSVLFEHPVLMGHAFPYTRWQKRNHRIINKLY